MSNGFVLGIMCSKSIRVSSPIPFKSQLCSRHGGFGIYMMECASGKTGKEMSAMLKHASRQSTEQARFHHIFMYTIIIFYIVCMQHTLPVCVISSVRALWTRHRHMLLTSSINNKNCCTIDLFSWSMVQFFSYLKIAMCQQCARTHLVFRPAARLRTNELKCICYLKQQRGTGHENDNCVKLKLAENTLCLVYDRALCLPHYQGRGKLFARIVNAVHVFVYLHLIIFSI